MTDQLSAKLQRHGQEHLLRFWDALDEAGRRRLAGEIEQLDLDLIERLVAGADEKPDFADLARRGQPPPAVRADGSGTTWTVDEATRRGVEALRAGRVGMVLVAGGQGTRLGFDQPKSLFPIGPLSGRTLLQMQVDRLQALAARHRVAIPLYLMTSPATHEATIRYLTAENWLGKPRDDLRVFCQGTMPAVDKDDGKLLLDAKDSLATSPDGHGGMVAAFQKSGCLDDATRRGIEHLFYAQIDNPLAEVCDPTLIGHHIMAGSEMTTQVIRKRYPLERVGNVVLVDGRVRIIEYSDLPDEVAEQTTEDGLLRLWAGSIAVHVFERAFLQRAAEQAELLPFHRAIKKVPYVDASGNRVEPEQPNAVKFERFIFDLLPAAENAIVVEGRTEDVFAPVKNAEGAPADTASAARDALLAQHRRWLEAAGATVEDGVRVEIHPGWAIDAAEVAEKIEPGTRIASDTYFQPNS